MKAGAINRHGAVQDCPRHNFISVGGLSVLCCNVFPMQANPARQDPALNVRQVFLHLVALQGEVVIIPHECRVG